MSGSVRGFPRGERALTIGKGDQPRAANRQHGGIRQRIDDFGVTVVDMPDPHFYSRPQEGKYADHQTKPMRREEDNR
jgi:hypothetical protein